MRYLLLHQNIDMRILLLGSGGREHAFALKISQSPKVESLLIAQGNGGTEALGTNINISPTDFEAVKNCVIQNSINCLVVGPETPLVNGIVDYFEADETLKNVTVIGPNKLAATLEGSKDFSKQFMQKYNIPTAAYKTFTKDELNEAKQYLKEQKLPIVLKADGLAAGKGVLICKSLNEAEKELEEMLNGKFGEAGAQVVIEEFLDGIEFSAFAISDGKNYQILPTAKDYKRIGEGDTGLNTGGMGSVSPAPFVDETLMQKTINQVIAPTFNGLAMENINYIGFLFIGLMVVNGEPYVIEYNCRMGDPETQSVFSLMENDFIDLFEAIKNKQLDKVEIIAKNASAATVVLASGGYPESYQKGKLINGLEDVIGSTIFHAGTKKDGDNLLTSGGRVMAITTVAPTLKHAVEQSMRNAQMVDFEGKYFRRDIGQDVLHL